MATKLIPNDLVIEDKSLMNTLLPSKIDNANIVDSLGSSSLRVPSQKLLTEQINSKDAKVQSLENQIRDVSNLLTFVKDNLCIDSSGDGWLRLTNGTQICWGNFRFTSGTAFDPWGSTFDKNIAVNIKFKMPFFNIPIVSSIMGTDSYAGSITRVESTNTNIYNVTINRSTNGTDMIFLINYIAIGKWK